MVHSPFVDPQSGTAPATHRPIPPLMRPDERLTATHCCFCGMQCGMFLRVHEETGRVVGVEPRYDWPVNEGRLCPKGVLAYTQLNHPERLLTPLMRRNGRLVEASWEEALDRGTRLIVIDPRQTHIARAAHQHLKLRPGTDVALALGILHVLIEEDLIDRTFIVERTRGFEEAAAAAQEMPPDRAAEITGLLESEIIQAARWYGRAPRAMILHARGVEHHANGTDNVLALINLALATGKVGRSGCGIMTLTGQGNGQGGREHGQKSDQLPGYRKITDPAARAHVASVWGVPEEWIPGPGHSAVEMFEAMDRGEIRGLYLMCSNPMVSLPAINKVETALKRLEFFACADFFLSETARLADVVLPVTMWAEDEGTTTNVEGRVIKHNKAVEPPADIPTDWQLMCELARRLGKGEYFPYTEPRQIWDELRRASQGGIADYYGITYEKIEAQKGVFWPYPSLDHPGTPRLFEERFAHPDGRAVMHPVSYTPRPRSPTRSSRSATPPAGWSTTT